MESFTWFVVYDGVYDGIYDGIYDFYRVFETCYSTAYGSYVFNLNLWYSLYSYLEMYWLQPIFWHFTLSTLSDVNMESKQFKQ